MHELSMMEGIMEKVEKQAAENNVRNIKKIKLVVGELKGISPDSLKFCFEMLPKKQLFNNTSLEVELRKASAKCQDCGKKFSADPKNYGCPYCAATDVEVISGEEFYIDYFEGE